MEHNDYITSEYLTMKKIVCFIGFVILASTCFPQNSNVNIGIKIMPNITWFGGNSIFGPAQWRASVSPGVEVHYQLKKQIELISGLYFARKGSKSEVILTSRDGQLLDEDELDFYSDYLVLPISVSFTTGGHVKFYFQAGTFMGFLLDHTAKTSVNIEGADNNYYDYRDDFKDIDFGAGMGVGVYIPVGSSFYLDLGIHYQLGLIDTSHYNTRGHRFRTHLLGISLGLFYWI